jgi:hypothetical protein
MCSPPRGGQSHRINVAEGGGVVRRMDDGNLPWPAPARAANQLHAIGEPILRSSSFELRRGVSRLAQGRWCQTLRVLRSELRRGVSRLARASVPPPVSTGAWDGSRWVVDPTTTGSRAARATPTAAQAPAPIDSRRAGLCLLPSHNNVHSVDSRCRQGSLRQTVLMHAHYGTSNGDRHGMFTTQAPRNEHRISTMRRRQRLHS